MEETRLPIDAKGNPNRSYLGHTSELIPTPWPREGMYIEPGMPRRFPKVKDRTPQEEAERKRLAEIENPGRCQSRQNKIDSWCRRFPTPGLKVCYKHGGKFVHSKKAAARNLAEQKLQNKARNIVNRAMK